MDFHRLPPKKNSKEAWLEWLSDEPPAPAAQAELRQKRVERANSYMPRRPDHSVKSAEPPPSVPAVSIQINVPTFHRPQFKRTKAAWHVLKPHLTKPRIVGISAVAVMILAGWLVLHTLKVSHDKQAARAAAQQIQAGQIATSKPSFTPVVPSTESQLATPDNVHSRYDVTKGSYSYNDAVGGKQFTVSQQQLASASAVDTAVGQASKSLNATVQLKTGWGTAYLGTNQKYNSQTVVFGIKDLLVFIQSPSTFTSDQWITYINSLQ